MSRAERGRSLGEERAQLGGLLGQPLVTHVHVQELSEALEDAVGEALRDLAGVPGAHVHAGPYDQGEPQLGPRGAVVVEDRRAVGGHERERDDDNEGARALLLRAVLKLKEHVAPVVFEASHVRPADVRHVTEDRAVAV